MTLNEIEDKDVENFKALLDYLKQLSEDGINSLIEKPLLKMLDLSLPFFTNLVLIGEFRELKRITINKNVVGQNKRIYDIKFLKYPPAEKIKKYGRCNYPGQSVLYASFLAFTALNEMKPRVGDLITETTWRAKRNQTLKYCPIFKNQPLKEKFINPRTLDLNRLYKNKIKTYPENVRKQIDAFVQFVTDSFTKRVYSKNHYDYIFSAYFSDKIFHHFEDGDIEAIYYPSVQEKLSFENVAIKPEVFDKKFELTEVHDSVVVTDPSNGRGGYMMEGLGECKSFDFASGKVLWDLDKFLQPDYRLNELKKYFGIKFEK